LSTLADIAEAEPKFFKENFNITFEFIKWVVYDKEIDDIALKEIAVNFIITIIERIPSIAKKEKDRTKLKEIVNMLFHGMINIDNDIDKDWMKPPEGFKDDAENGENDNDEVHFGM